MQKEKVYELKKLSASFYQDYPENLFPEMEHKPERPYIVMLIKIKGNIFAVPFRTNIKHKNCYAFKNTNRDTSSSTGIDFTKAVIITKNDYLGEAATIDNKEYYELNDRYYFIISKFKTFVNNYIRFACGKIENEYVCKGFKYTTLKYFHKELGIEESNK